MKKRKDWMLDSWKQPEFEDGGNRFEDYVISTSKVSTRQPMPNCMSWILGLKSSIRRGFVDLE